MTHIPGHIATGETATDGEFLSQFAGQVVFTQDGQSWRIEAVPSGSITTYRLVNTQTNQRLSGNQMRGLTFIDNLEQGHTIGTVSGGDYPLTSRSLSEGALGRFFGVSETTGGTAPSFASTRAAADLAFQQAQELARQEAERAREAAELAFQNEQTTLAQQHENALAILERELEHATGLQAQRIQAEIDLENMRHENDLVEIGVNFENRMKELKVQFEAQLKQQFIGEIGAERRTLIQEKGKAREQQVERAGQDPFKFAFNVRGQEAATTPEDIFKREQRAFINQPLPELNFNASLPELQAQLGTVRGIQPPTGGFLGLPSLAHGGFVSPRDAINMQRGTDGVFSRVPAIVGDAGPELALLPPGAEIIPLNKLQGVDLTGIPRAQGGFQVRPPSVFEERRFPPLLPAGGIEAPVAPSGPQLVRMEGANGVYALGPDGQYHLVLNPQSMLDMGFSFDDIVVLSPADFDQFVTVNRGVNIPQGSTDFSFLKPTTPIERVTSEPPVLPSAFDPEALEAILNLANLPFLQRIRLGAGLPATGPLGQGAFPQLGVLPPGVNQPVTTGAFATRNPLTLQPALTDLGVPAEQANLISNQFGPFVSPFKAASTLGLGLRNFLPQEQTGINSLYGLLGFSPADITAQIEAVTPTGRFQNPQRLGFRGTFL